MQDVQGDQSRRQPGQQQHGAAIDALPFRPFLTSEASAQYRVFENQRQRRQQDAVAFAEYGQQGARAQTQNQPCQPGETMTAQQPLPTMQPGQQSQQDKGRRQHGFALHDIQCG